MIVPIALFEVRRRLRQISTYVYFLIFFALAFFTMLAFGGAFKSINVTTSSGKVMANGPYTLSSLITFLSCFGLLVTSAVMGRAVQQDFEHNTHPLFFTAPIRKLQYLGGRFLGTFVVLVLIFSSLGLGMLATEEGGPIMLEEQTRALRGNR